MIMFLTAAVSYLLGSIPFGLILLRVFRGQDVRPRAAATSAPPTWHAHRPTLGVLTLVLDALKGLARGCAHCAPSFPDGIVLGRPWPRCFRDPGTHVSPCGLKFRGGKGVATALGSFALLAPKTTAGNLGRLYCGGAGVSLRISGVDRCSRTLSCSGVAAA